MIPKHPIGFSRSRLSFFFALTILAALFSSHASAQTSTISNDTWIEPGTYLSSPNGRYQLWMQTDGNLVLYIAANGTALWHTHTYMYPTLRAKMQSDGNLVLYNVYMQPYWQSQTAGNPGAYLTVQDDGNLVIYAANGSPLWQSQTVQYTGPVGCYNYYSGCTTCFSAGGYGQICNSWTTEQYPSDWVWIGDSYEYCSAISPLPFAGGYCY